MNNKLVGLVINQMSENDLKLFMFEEFHRSSINFVVYDLSILVYGIELNKKYCEHSIDKIEDLILLLEKEEYFMLYFNRAYIYKMVFDVLDSYNKKTFFRIANGKVLSKQYSSFSFKKIEKVFKLFDKNFRKNFFYTRMHQKSGIQPMLFESGISDYGIEIPSFEYDQYLKIRQKNIQSKKNYHLFLDTNIAYHRDIEISGMQGMKCPEIYYKNLRLFFDNVEEKTNKKVKIALHPRRKDSFDDFGKRETIAGNTAMLAWEADLIFGDLSTSLHYAIIYKKDLILITNDEINQSDLTFDIDLFQMSLDLKKINIDHFSDFDNIYGYTNQKRYSDYIEENIISGKAPKDKLGSEIVVEYFENLFKGKK